MRVLQHRCPDCADIWELLEGTTPAPDRWISVSERLPAPYRTVIGWIVSGNIADPPGLADSCCYSGRRGVWLFSMGEDDAEVEVTDWLPMPEAPTGSYHNPVTFVPATDITQIDGTAAEQATAK